MMSAPLNAFISLSVDLLCVLVGDAMHREADGRKAVTRKIQVPLRVCVNAARGSISVAYRSPQPTKDIARLGKEADRVFEQIRSEAERRRAVRVSVLPSDARGSVGFSYYHQGDDSWERAPVREANNYPDPLFVGVAGEFSSNELSLIGQAVSRLPVLGSIEGLSTSGVCLVAESGYYPTRLGVTYDGRLDGAGSDRLGLVLSEVREAAEKLAIRRATVTFNDQGKPKSYELKRNDDGAWRTKVVTEP